MATPVLDWKTRLAVSYTDANGSTVHITPIDSFAPSFSLNVEAVHSLERTHIGAVFSPKNITFSMTVKAIGEAAAKLTTLALKGSRFDITLQEHDGNDWSFKTIVLSECLITAATPTTASVGGAPTATFSGLSMQATTEGKDGVRAAVP
jgi:hypothetical protein